MKTRKEAAALINEQLKRDLYQHKPGHAWHYGKVELRELLDFIYEGEPESEEEKIK